MSYRNSSKEKGFTIIEILIATTIFSVVLLVFLTAFVKISQVFYKGVTMSQVQEATRNTLNSISDDIQFTKNPPSPNPATDYFCIADHRYTFKKGVQVASGVYAGVYRENVGANCQDPLVVPVDTNTAEQMLGNGMQLNDLNVNCPTNNACNVRILVVYYGNDNTVLISPSHSSPEWQATDAQCSGPAISSQLCATAVYQSTVLQKF